MKASRSWSFKVHLRFKSLVARAICKFPQCGCLSSWLKISPAHKRTPFVHPNPGTTVYSPPPPATLMLLSAYFSNRVPLTLGELPCNGGRTFGMAPSVAIQVQNAESKKRCANSVARLYILSSDLVGSDVVLLTGVKFNKPLIKAYINGGQTLGASHCSPTVSLIERRVNPIRDYSRRWHQHFSLVIWQ